MLPAENGQKIMPIGGDIHGEILTFWYSHNKRIFIKKELGIQNNSAFGQGSVRFGKDGTMTCAGIRH